MATISKYRDAWKCQVRKKGLPAQTRSFPTKAEAERWGRSIEAEMDRGTFLPANEAEQTSLSAVLARYLTEVSVTKRSVKSDEGRARRIGQHLGSYRLVKITPAVLATYRNDRLKTLAPQTVVHDLNLINRALRIATSEWGIVLPAGVPRVIKPKRPEGRDRRVTEVEIEALIAGTESPELALIVGLAVETAMRRSEIVSLKKEHISLERRVAFLPTTKNDKPRRVPLSTRALSVIEQAWPLTISDTGPLLTMRADSATKAFVRAVRRERKRHIEGCKRRGTAPDPHFMVDLRFHDLRHEAISRAAEKGLNVIELAAVSGHKTLSMLGRYTHLRAEDLARKLG